MALIKCPECGRDVSDKAEVCPGCGVQLKKQEKPKRVKCEIKLEKSAKMLIFCIVIVVALFVLMYVLNGAQNVVVKNISMEKYELTYDGEYISTYDAVITSDTKKPFVAVIGDYEGNDNNPQFVYMKDGKGTAHVITSDDDDPSTKYKPIGYMTGKTCKESAIKSVKYKDEEYDDYLDDTYCSMKAQIEMNNNYTGLLFVEISNDMTKDIDNNQIVYMVDGKGELNVNISDLPYKSRGVKVSITPEYFCKLEKLKDKDYSVVQKLKFEKEDSTSYNGESKYKFKDIESGRLIYTKELLSGGDPKDIGDVEVCSSYIKDKVCEINIYTYVDDDETISEPKYDIELQGYITWKEIDGGKDL